jgi:integrase
MEISQKSQKLPQIYAKGSNLVATHLNFTKKAIEGLPSPTTARHVYCHDSGGALSVRGLAVRVSFTGSKVFVLYRRIAGKPERIVLGPFPDITVEQARGRASELNAKIAAGKNPATEKREIRDEMTLQELFAQWGEFHGKGKRSWLLMKREFDVYLKPWHFRKISSITRLNVIALQNSLKHKHGLYVSNHIIRLLSSLYNRAIEWGWQGENPAKVPLFVEKKRQRFLLPQEAPAFFTALNEEPEIIRDFVMVSLLTGARRANVQAMSWPEIDFTQKLWTILAANAKGNEVLTIPLLPPVVEILRRRKKGAIGEWVFPSHGTTGHLVEVKSAWSRILKRAGIVGLRFHDLRRTMGSFQALSGSSLLVIGKSLGHKSLAATQVYARLNDDSVRSSMQRGINALLLAGKVQENKV